MTAAADVEALQVDRLRYQALMSEVKARIFAVRSIVERIQGLHPQIVTETCYLQLRLCCECIALGCLAVHRSVPGSTVKGLMKAYQPGVIMNRLERLHRDFYPAPWTVNLTDKGWHMTADRDALASFMNCAALISLWNSLGASLHKGSLETFLAAEGQTAKEQTVVEDTLVTLGTFLKLHAVIATTDLTSSFAKG